MKNSSISCTYLHLHCTSPEHPGERELVKELKQNRKEFLAKFAHDGVKGEASYLIHIDSRVE